MPSSEPNVMDEQCPDRCGGVAGHSGPHQSGDWDESLDFAWREAEAALPDGWGIDTLRVGRHYQHDPEIEWVVWAGERFPDYLLPRNDRTAFGRGPTPEAALQALTVRLQGKPGDGA